ncbi:hypothetical protein [Burkholderia ambifaria]|uniref:hypothetical protein n=1 Tax=Burkholderia ambifaria TaxID=152480 RepID=UPI00158929CC|nr:hypothetical protein [Burkholderia ambifaria]MBR8343020.1 hypothetical protein [Burkholderia ambifaria]
MGAHDAGHRNGAAGGPVRPSGTRISSADESAAALTWRFVDITDPASTTAIARAIFVPEAAHKRHVSAGFIATASGSQRTAHRARENRLARYGTPESPRTPRFDPAEFDRANYAAPHLPTSPTRKKAPAHKAAGANGTTTT